MSYGITDSQYYSDIADAIREKRTDLPAETEFMPSEMAEAILGISGESHVDPETQEWIRPEAWPDLDSINTGEENTLYMTIDATGRIPDPHLSILIGTNADDTSLPSSSFTVDIGEIQNGVYVVLETQTVENNGTYQKSFTPSPNYYPVVRISAVHLRRWQFKDWSVNNYYYIGQWQPVVEVVGSCEYMQYDARTCYFTERENITIKSTSGQYLANRWNAAYLLKKLEFGDSIFSAWQGKSLENTWLSCFSLVSLDLSDWVTSTWTNSSLKSTWYDCRSLRFLDVSTWDTTNWGVTAMNNTWCGCYSLEALDLSSWNTTNWRVESMTSTWDSCEKLRELDLSGFNTTNWRVTNMAGTWSSCHSLRSLDLHNWNTTNWKVNTFNAAFSNSHRLHSVNFTGWDTTNWTFSNNNQLIINHCTYLTDLDLSWLDMSKITRIQINGVKFIQNLTFGSNNSGKFKPTATTWNAGASTFLTRQSMLNFIDALAPGGNTTIWFGEGLNRLTSEEKAIATNKGYTLA